MKPIQKSQEIFLKSRYNRDIMGVYELGPFGLDTRNGLLLHGGAPLALGRRAVGLLQALIESRGTLVSKDVLMEPTWPGQAVEEGNLAVEIVALRRGLAKAPGRDRWIETMPRRGYRFVGPVVANGQNSVSAAPLQVAAPLTCHDDTLSCKLDSVGAGGSETGLEDLPETVGALQHSASEIVGHHGWHGRAIVGMVTAATFVLGCLVCWLWPARKHFSQTINPAEQATSVMLATTRPTADAISPPLVAPRLSIVVLPFTNLSNDPDQQYFADGITENRTTDLSRIPDLFVISANSAFTYQGKRAKTNQIGRELGVRYVLDGSVERLGNRVRLNAS
jgi:TolB-like protein/DNA-binding winged helix-turn-helix (wHTH) protein